MTKSQITQARLHELFEYKEGKLFWKIKHSRKTVIGQEAGTFRETDGYRQVMIDYVLHRTHRLVFLYHHGYLPAKVDHIDNDPTNNRIENLRPTTTFQNACNSKMRPDNTSGVKGVTWDKNKKSWLTRIYVQGKCINLGRFKDFELAEFVATEARMKYHGAFANHG